MANTFTNINGAILSQMVFDSAVAGLAPLSAFSTDFKAEAAQKGATITAGIIPGFSTSRTKTTGADYTIDPVSNSSVQITLPKEPTYVSYSITDTEVAQSPIVKLETFAGQKAYGLYKTVLDDVFSEITAANYGASGVAVQANAFDSDAVLSLIPKATKLGWDRRQLSLVLSSDYYWALMRSLANTASYGNSGPIQNGVITGLFGIKQVIEAPTLPTNSENLVGFLSAPGSMAVAGRYLQPQSGNQYSRAEPMTDPVSGITIGVRQWYSNDAGESRTVFEALWGKKVIDYGGADKMSNGLVRITSA